MPRRMITPEICRNEKVASLPDAGRFLFIGIFSNADDDGRLKASPKFLKATIFPYDEDKTASQVTQLRDQCAVLGLIRLYSKNGTEYLDLPGWREHQLIRKDRYRPSKLPGFDEADEVWQPSGNQVATSGLRSIGEGRLVKSSLVTPLLRKGARTKQGDPVINEIFAEMRKTLGCPEKVCEPGSPAPGEKKEAKDPIPNYGKEGKAIKRMLTRGFTREEILACWRSKVSQRGGEFVSMTWVNEDIGKKGGANGADGKHKPLTKGERGRDIRGPLR